MRLSPQLYISNNAYSLGHLFQIYEAGRNRKYIGNGSVYGEEKYIDTRREAYPFIAEIIFKSVSSENYGKYGKRFDHFLRYVRWESSEFLKFNRGNFHNYLKNLTFDCKVQVMRYLKDSYDKYLSAGPCEDKAHFMFVLLKFFRIYLPVEGCATLESFVALEQNRNNFDNFATKNCVWIKGIKPMEKNDPFDDCDNFTKDYQNNQNNQTQEEDNKMTNTPDQKTLYKFIADNGVETFCNFLAVDSSLKWVIEVKGTGAVMAVEKDKLEEVCPFTILIRDMGNRDLNHYNVESHTDLFFEGMIFISNGGYFYSVEKLNTKAKVNRNLDPTKIQIVSTAPLVPTVKVDEKPKS